MIKNSMTKQIKDIEDYKKSGEEFTEKRKKNKIGSSDSKPKSSVSSGSSKNKKRLNEWVIP